MNCRQPEMGNRVHPSFLSPDDSIGPAAEQVTITFRRRAGRDSDRNYRRPGISLLVVSLSGCSITRGATSPGGFGLHNSSSSSDGSR
jgi:hypothetical protein